jgi:hypothetical protein
MAQHTPAGSHVLGVHVPPRNQSCAASPHADCTDIAHPPVNTLQQRPCGGGHGFGEQTIVVNQVLPVRQRACVSRRHEESVSLQQIPAGSHVLGVQVPPRAHVCPPRLQFVEGCIAHVPLTTLQQRPCGGGQRFGLHVRFTVQVPVVHAARSPTEHAADAVQQRPGCGHVLGEHAPPIAHVEAQPLWSVSVHAPLLVQHRPGCAQVLGEHTPPVVHVAEHPLCNVTEHVPALVQQDPGCAQMFGEHVPAVVHVAEHALCSVTVHVPALVQQLPGCGHTFGEHVPPVVHAAAQPLWSVTEHVPEFVQHRPGCGHGLGEQVAPVVHVAAHPLCSVTEHAPPLVQQLPGCGQTFGEHVAPVVQVAAHPP